MVSEVQGDTSTVLYNYYEELRLQGTGIGNEYVHDFLWNKERGAFFARGS